MESFLFAVNAVLPIILMVAVGYLLRRINLLKEDVARALNRLVFRVFLPVMLFLNVYRIQDLAKMEFGYMAYVLGVVMVIFFLAIPVVLSVTSRNDRRGPLWQASFRSNFALIGIPLAGAMAGERGEILASILSAATVPLFNVLAVIALSVFGKGEKKVSVGRILWGIVTNPLIIGILLGFVCLGVRSGFEALDISFRLTDVKPVYKMLEYLSAVATPLALICLGGQFAFSAIGELRREILTGTLLRALIAPIIGVGVAFLLFRDRFGAAEFACFVGAFSTPVAVSSAPMAQEMGGDASLAGQLVVWSTLLSGVTIFLATLLLKVAGVF